MNCSSDIAISLLDSWRERSTVLNVFLAPNDGLFRLAALGTVHTVTSELVLVSLAVAGNLVFDLANAIYDYSDSREAAPEFREIVEREVVCTLKITTPGYVFAFGEPTENLIAEDDEARRPHHNM